MLLLPTTLFLALRLINANESVNYAAKGGGDGNVGQLVSIDAKSGGGIRWMRPPVLQTPFLLTLPRRCDVPVFARRVAVNMTKMWWYLSLAFVITGAVAGLGIYFGYANKKDAIYGASTSDWVHPVNKMIQMNVFVGTSCYNLFRLPVKTHKKRGKKWWRNTFDFGFTAAGGVGLVDIGWIVRDYSCTPRRGTGAI